MGKMARCDICEGVIRKADVVERVTLTCGLLRRVTVHRDPESNCRHEFTYSGDVSHPYLPVTPELETLIALVEEHQRQVSSRQAVERARQEERDGDLADYVCRLELETDRHGSKPCRAPGCPVTALFTFHAPDAIAVYKHRSNGCYLCGMCGTVASEDNSGRECHSCRDWSGCGGSCTLVAVYCTACGTRETV